MFTLVPFERKLVSDFMNPEQSVLLSDLEWPPVFKLKVDLLDKGDHYELKADLPGVKKEDLKITVTGETLSIEAKKETVKDVNEENFVCHERSSGSFVRSFDIRGIEEDEITGSFADGVLRLVLPKEKAQESGGRTLELADEHPED